VRRGAHARLIGEQSPLDPLTDGHFQGIAQTAADDSVGDEGVAEDHPHRLRQVPDPAHQHHKSPQQVQRRHDRHQLLRDSGDALDTSQKHHRRQHRHHDAHRPRRHTEGGSAGLPDGVGLHHAPHEAQRQNQRHGEKAR